MDAPSTGISLSILFLCNVYIVSNEVNRKKVKLTYHNNAYRSGEVDPSDSLRLNSANNLRCAPVVVVII